MKKVLITVLLVVLFSPVFAGFTFSPGIQGTLGASFCHPTDEYLKSSQGQKLPELRTSFYVDFDAMLAEIIFDNSLETAVGFSMLWTSQSLAAGIHVLQPYIGTGLSVFVNKYFKNDYALGLKTRLMFCKYRPYDYKFSTIDVSAVPSKKVFDDQNYDIFMMCPVTLSFRSDAVTVRAGLGFNVKYNVRLIIERKTEAEKV